MSDRPAASTDPVVFARAALETLVFAPIGLGAQFVEDAPRAVRRVRQELTNARLVGRLTVEQGAARLRERAGTGSRVVADAAGSGATPSAESTAGDRGSDELPIDGYDEMPAIEIVALLDALTSEQRSTIASHERAHRQRRTVLGKIDQLNE